jgi:hypothetical protein
MTLTRNAQIDAEASTHILQYYREFEQRNIIAEALESGSTSELEKMNTFIQAVRAYSEELKTNSDPIDYSHITP